MKRRRMRRMTDAELHVIAAAYCNMPSATFDAIVAEENAVEEDGRIRPFDLRSKLNFLLRIAPRDPQH